MRGEEAPPSISSVRAVRDGNRERDDTNATSVCVPLVEKCWPVDGAMEALWHVCPHQKRAHQKEGTKRGSHEFG